MGERENLMRKISRIICIVIALALTMSFLVACEMPFGGHSHEYLDNGKCSCGQLDPAHTHEYVDGECVCGKLDPSVHRHSYGSNGKCSCGQLDPTHVHEYGEDGRCSCGAYHPEYKSEGLIFVEIGENEYEVSQYVGSAAIVVIPSVYEGGMVKSIGERAFEGAYMVKSVVIPISVMEIKDYAFYNCSGLKGISIPASVKRIGKGAFSECRDVTMVEYGATNCETLDFDEPAFLFLGRTAMNDATREGVVVTVKANVQIIPENLFYGNNYQQYPYITSVVFEDNSQCKSIGDTAFMHARSLKTFDLGENSKLERIGDSCFGNCMALESFTIPSSVKVVEKYAFSATNSLQEIIVEDKENWCASRFNLWTWERLDYYEFATEEVDFFEFKSGKYNAYYLSKVGDGIPDDFGYHQHEFDEYGVCYCLMVEQGHVHAFDADGVCPCLETDQTHEHSYNEYHVCKCRAYESSHVHEYSGNACRRCGEMKP